MSTLAEPSILPAAKPLDEAVWQAWTAKGRALDRRSDAAIVNAVKFVSIVGLLAAAWLSNALGPFDVVVRFIVTAGAIVVVVQAAQSKHYGEAVAVCLLALLYNQPAPPFGFSGYGQRALVMVSAVPFIASFTWRNASNQRTKHYD